MKKLLSLMLSLLMVFSLIPMTMSVPASAAADKYTFDWIRKDGVNDFNETITSASGTLTTNNYNDGTCMTTNRTLVVNDKLSYATKTDVAKGLYKVIFELRAYTGRADLNIKVGDRDYGKFVSPGGGSDTKVTLFEDYVHAEDGPLTITFTALSAGSFYIEQLHLEKMDWAFEVADSQVTVTDYLGFDTNLKIPSTMGGFPVTGLAKDAFKGDTGLVTVDVPASVTNIAEDAFAGCSSLEEITINNSECVIFDSATTISDTAVVSGPDNSTAQAYAEKYDRTFKKIVFAQIGDKTYSTLGAALSDAKEGDVVVVLKDTKEKLSVTLDEEITIDLAGFTVTSYGTAKVINTTAPITIRSTVDGLGETPTAAKANFKYSGALLTTSANITVDNVNFKEANSFPEYEEVSIFDADSATWEHKRFRYQNNYWGLGTYDNYTRTANSTLIPVEPSTQYYFKCIEDLADTFAIEVFSYKVKADGDAHPDTGVTVPDGKEVSVTGSLGATSGGVITTGSSTAYIGINVYCSSNEWGYNNSKDKIMPKLKDGTITPFISKVIDLCERDKTVKNSLFNITADGTTFKATNSIFDKSSCDSGSSDYFEFKKATTLDIDGCTFKSYNLNGKDLVAFNNAGLKGTIKNSTIGANNGNGVRVTSTDATTGLTFEKSTVTGGGDGRVAFVVAGGYVRLIEGTFGNNSASMNTYLNGGKVYINGTKFNSSKRDCALSIAEAADVTIESAIIVKSPKTLNDQTIFLNSLMEGKAVYSSATASDETILSRTASFNSLDNLYVLPCEHYCVGAQAGSKTCAYCLTEEAEIVHNYTKYGYDETQHWGTCARCDEVQPKQDHAVGENGKKATCTEPAVCGVCAQNFGEELGHSFTKYEQVSTDIAGCEHNPVTKAICDNGCGEEDYDYSALVNLEVTKEAVAPTCTEEGATQEQSCTECQKVIEPAEVIDALGHDFGEVEVIEDSNYAYTGKGKHTCVRDDCGFTEEVVIPVKEFKGSTIAILGDYDNPEEYKTIQEAIDAADEGETIIVVKDGKLEGKVALDKEIVLDLAGHTLEATTDSVSFETTKNIELRSTQLGLGEVYSGVVPVEPSTDEDTYGTIADVPNGDLYVMGHYNSGAGKLEAYENRIANKKLIAVDSSRSYIFKTGCNIQYVIREFNKKGRFAKSVGAVADGATYTPSSPDVAYIGVAFWISGDSKTDILSMIQSDEFNPTIELNSIKGTVNFSKPFVKTSAQFKMSNIKAVSAANTTFVESSSADVAAPAKFIAKDSEFAALKKTGSDGKTTEVAAIPLKFTANAIELDIQDSTIRSTTGNGLEINSAGVFGTIKNTKITKNSGNAINVSKTADAGVVFDGCSISQGGWDTTAAQVSGGKVTFTGGAAISGSNMASTVLNASGGTIILDGVTLSGDKGADTNRRLLYFNGSPNVIIKNANFQTGTANGAKGVITNNFASFTASLAEGSAFFSSTVKDVNTVMSGANVTSALRNIYVGECGHWERSVSKAETCTTAHTCNFCAMSFDALGHDYSAYDNDEDTHWRICSRCKIVDPEDNEPEAHFGGTATCDEPAECEACQEYHGEPLGHAFPEPNEDGSYDAEDYTYDADNHWICCTRDGCETAKEGSIEAHNGGEATCEDKAVCEDCGQEYGLALGHSYIRYVSNNDASCNIDGTETAFCENGCGTSVSRIDEGSKLGHSWVVSYGYDANCKETGLTDGSYCENCNFVREEQEIIPIKPNAHTWDDGYIKQDGNCSVDCIYVYTCLDCEKTQEYNLGKIEGKHEFDTVFTVDKAATFEEEGLMSKHCKHCGESTSEVKLEKLKISANKTDNGIQINWDAYDGEGVYYELYRKVNNSDFIMIQNYLTQPECLDHQAVVKATYQYKVVLYCGDVVSTSDIVEVVIGDVQQPSSSEDPTEPSDPTDPSEPSSEPTEPSQDPSSEEPSSQKPTPSVVKPTQPTTAKPTQPTTPTVKPCVHTTTVKGAVAATCFAEGYTGDTVCVKCGATVTKGSAIAKIKLAKPKFTAKKKGKKIKVKYTKVAGATGFQIRYRIKGKWTVKTFNNVTKATVTKTLKKLKKGTYKVQVRALAKGSTTLYSKWAKKKVKIK